MCWLRVLERGVLVVCSEFFFFCGCGPACVLSIDVFVVLFGVVVWSLGGFSVMSLKFRLCRYWYAVTAKPLRGLVFGTIRF